MNVAKVLDLQGSAVANPEVMRVTREDPAVRAAWLRAHPVALGMGAAVLVVALLFCIPNRASIAPIVEADNAYIFLAADRLYEGDGPTATPPRAPQQPWTWRADWVFLTQWPVGYPMLLVAMRWLTGGSTMQAAQTLAVICCGIALVAWFAWVRSCLPRGVLATMIALVAAGATFSMQNLVHPASDTVMLAALPVVLLLFRWADGREDTSPTRMAMVGVLAGSLFWLRYAALFVPVALGGYLLVRTLCRRGRGTRALVAFAMAGLLPILGLAMLNRTLGADVSTQEQFNLGSGVSWRVSPEVFAVAWRNFAQQTPYAHRPEAAAFYLWGLPIIGLGLPLAFSRCRARAIALLRSPPILLSACVALSLLGLLVAATIVFAGKYNYVGLLRYYQPVRPLYFLLLLGPLAVLPYRGLCVAACVPLVLVCTWFVNQDARRAHARMLARDVEVTGYGRQARHFQPRADELFAWLRARASKRLVVFSNFHEEIALETRIPACPVPKSETELNDWLARISRVRGVSDLDVLFVLHPDNDYRDYYLDPPAKIIEQFELSPVTIESTASAPDRVFAPRPRTANAS